MSISKIIFLVKEPLQNFDSTCPSSHSDGVDGITMIKIEKIEWSAQLVQKLDEREIAEKGAPKYRFTVTIAKDTDVSALFNGCADEKFSHLHIATLGTANQCAFESLHVCSALGPCKWYK